MQVQFLEDFQQYLLKEVGTLTGFVLNLIRREKLQARPGLMTTCVQASSVHSLILSE